MYISINFGHVVYLFWKFVFLIVLVISAAAIRLCRTGSKSQTFFFRSHVIIFYCIVLKIKKKKCTENLDVFAVLLNLNTNLSLGILMALCISDRLPYTALNFAQS